MFEKVATRLDSDWTLTGLRTSTSSKSSELPHGHRSLAHITKLNGCLSKCWMRQNGSFFLGKMMMANFGVLIC